MITKRNVLPRVLLISRRLGANAVDACILAAVVAAATIGVAWIVGMMMDMPSAEQLQVIFAGVPADHLTFAWYEAIARGIAPYVMAGLPAIWWAYESMFAKLRMEGTPGKWLFRLATRSAADRKLRFGEILLRSAMKVVTLTCLLFIASPAFLAAVAGLLLLIPLMSANGQFLHDFIPGTNVVAKAKAIAPKLGKAE